MLSDPAKNATKAARAAGYQTPRVDGSRLLRKFRQVIAEKGAEQAETAGMKADQVLSEIASIATDSTHKDRIRALELLAKINGLLSDRSVGDAKTLRQQLEELLKPEPVSKPESKRKSGHLSLVLTKTG